MRTTKRLVFMSILTAISLGIWVAEAQLPALAPVPGVKLGLANIITLTAMVLLGKREAGDILMLRIVLGAIFAGSFSAVIYSLAGGVAAWIVMALTIGRFSGKRLWIVSVFAAVAHNAGQLAAAVFVTKTAALWWYFPALLASGIVTGAFTGAAAMYLAKATARFVPKEEEIKPGDAGESGGGDGEPL